jgi:hypothetical protein
MKAPRPGVPDGGDGLQVWRVAADEYIENKISPGQPKRSGLSVWIVGGGGHNPHRKKVTRYEMSRMVRTDSLKEKDRVGWIHLAQNTVQWQALVNTIMNQERPQIY